MQTRRDKGGDLRRRAAALGVGSARSSVANRFPDVAAALSSQQVDQLQSSFDRIAVEQKFGPDEARRMRLDVGALLDPAELRPSSDNPDEARHLERVKQWVAHAGIWLHWSETLTAEGVDYATPYVFLSLGSERSGSIKVPNGKLDWAAVKTSAAVQTALYENVHKGGVATAFEQKVRRVLRDIEVERERHAELQVLRTSSTVVPWVADKLGRTSFPPVRMWDVPHELAVEALELRNAGRMADAESKLVAARLLTDKFSRRLTTYADKTVAGAKRALVAAVAAAAVAKAADWAGGPVSTMVRRLVGAGLRKAAARKLTRKAATEAGGRSKRRTIEEVADARAKVLERHADEAAAEELRRVRVLKDPRLLDRPLGNVKGSPRAGEGFSRY